MTSRGPPIPGSRRPGSGPRTDAAPAGPTARGRARRRGCAPSRQASGADRSSRAASRGHPDRERRLDLAELGGRGQPVVGVPDERRVELDRRRLGEPGLDAGLEVDPDEEPPEERPDLARQRIGALAVPAPAGERAGRGDRDRRSGRRPRPPSEGPRRRSGTGCRPPSRSTIRIRPHDTAASSGNGFGRSTVTSRPRPPVACQYAQRLRIEVPEARARPEARRAGTSRPGRTGGRCGSG